MIFNYSSLNDPMTLSLISGILSFFFSIFFLYVIKPKIITNHIYIIDWYKLFSLSIIIGILISIIVFLWFVQSYKNNPENISKKHFVKESIPFSFVF
jgi:hypothetical protein